MRIRWTPPAVADLQNISNYLEEHKPEFRLSTLRKLYESIRGLKETPYIGRPGRVEGTRELVFPPMPYVAVYHVSGQNIEIWRIYHGAQDRS